eukprot:ANDGO_05543.mRNA.1 hypothetical protein
MHSCMTRSDSWSVVVLLQLLMLCLQLVVRSSAFTIALEGCPALVGFTGTPKAALTLGSQLLMICDSSLAVSYDFGYSFDSAVTSANGTQLVASSLPTMTAQEIYPRAVYISGISLTKCLILRALIAPASNQRALFVSATPSYVTCSLFAVQVVASQRFGAAVFALGKSSLLISGTQNISLASVVSMDNGVTFSDGPSWSFLRSQSETVLACSELLSLNSTSFPAAIMGGTTSPVSAAIWTIAHNASGHLVWSLVFSSANAVSFSKVECLPSNAGDPQSVCLFMSESGVLRVSLALGEVASPAYGVGTSVSLGNTSFQYVIPSSRRASYYLISMDCSVFAEQVPYCAILSSMGLFLSVDGGLTWSLDDNGLCQPSQSTGSLACTPSGCLVNIASSSFWYVPEHRTLLNVASLALNRSLLSYESDAICKNSSISSLSSVPIMDVSPSLGILTSGSSLRSASAKMCSTPDGGTTWNPLDSTYIPDGAPSAISAQLKISRILPGYAFLVMRLSSSAAVYSSQDAGASWYKKSVWSVTYDAAPGFSSASTTASSGNYVAAQASSSSNVYGVYSTGFGIADSLVSIYSTSDVIYAVCADAVLSSTVYSLYAGAGGYCVLRKVVLPSGSSSLVSTISFGTSSCKNSLQNANSIFLQCASSLCIVGVSAASYMEARYFSLLYTIAISGSEYFWMGSRYQLRSLNYDSRGFWFAVYENGRTVLSTDGVSFRHAAVPVQSLLPKVTDPSQVSCSSETISENLPYIGCCSNIRCFVSQRGLGLWKTKSGFAFADTAIPMFQWTSLFPRNVSLPCVNPSFPSPFARTGSVSALSERNAQPLGLCSQLINSYATTGNADVPVCCSASSESRGLCQLASTRPSQFTCLVDSYSSMNAACLNMLTSLYCVSSCSVQSGITALSYAWLRDSLWPACGAFIKRCKDESSCMMGNARHCSLYASRWEMQFFVSMFWGLNATDSPGAWIPNPSNVSRSDVSTYWDYWLKTNRCSIPVPYVLGPAQYVAEQGPKTAAGVTSGAFVVCVLLFYGYQWFVQRSYKAAAP